MKKAFIFDMDGVIIATEKEWSQSSGSFSERLFGEKIHKQLGSQTGVSIEDTYTRAVGLGFQMSKEAYLNIFNTEAKKIFSRAVITPGFEDLVRKLSDEGFQIAVVTASPREWVDWALSRTSVKNKFNLILSTYGMGIPHKPSPVGYLRAMKKLGVTPEETIILEDSNPGITAGKASGAYTIALSENLVSGYIQIKDADCTVSKMSDVWSKVKKIKGK